MIFQEALRAARNGNMAHWTEYRQVLEEKLAAMGYEPSLLSREHWGRLCEEARIGTSECGVVYFQPYAAADEMRGTAAAARKEWHEEGGWLVIAPASNMGWGYLRTLYLSGRWTALVPFQGEWVWVDVSSEDHEDHEACLDENEVNFSVRDPKLPDDLTKCRTITAAEYREVMG